MPTGSEVGTRLTADNSQYRSVMAQSEQVADHAGRSILKKLDIKAGVAAVAFAIGFSINSIAENIARFVTSSSKSAEDALEKILKLGEETSKIYDEIYRKRRSEQQNIESDQQKQKRLLNEQKGILDEIAKKQAEVDAKNKIISERGAQDVKLKLRSSMPDLIGNVEQTEADKARLAEIANELAKLDQSIDESKRTRDEKAEKAKEEAAKKEKEAIKELADADLDWYKKRTQLEDQLRDQKVEGLKDDEKLTFWASEVVKWKKEQGRYEKDSNEYMALQVKINENNLDIEKLRLKTQKELTVEMQQQQAAVEAQNEAQGKQNLILTDTIILMGKAYGPSHNPDDVQNASTAALEDLVRKNTREIAVIEANKGSGLTAGADAATGFLPQGIVQARLQTDINRAQLEIVQRNKLAGAAATGGEALARKSFQGDPLEFDAAFRRADNGGKQADITRVADGLEKLNRHLRHGVPMRQLNNRALPNNGN